MLAFILSQPRSGSTVLSAMLDRRKGVVCMPESSFPQVLGAIRPEERADKRWLAALYMGSTFPPLPRPPTPLTLDDAESCMRDSISDSLLNLGRAVASKLGRNPQEVTDVVWKTTRTPGMISGPLSTGGKFVVLRRHAHNVYESQFRVDFGKANQNPFRYGIFANSYENVFSRLPVGRPFEIDYERIPKDLANLLHFLEIPDEGEWGTGSSTIDLVSQRAHWLTEATKEFKNDDASKRARLDVGRVRSLNFALHATSLFRPFMKPLRDYYDTLSLNHIRSVARMHISGEIPMGDA